jgi:hypothetical protein
MNPAHLDVEIFNPTRGYMQASERRSNVHDGTVIPTAQSLNANGESQFEVR